MSASSIWPATSAASGTGTASPASSATTTPTATSRCSKRSASCRRRSSPTAPRSSSTASASASTSASTTARSSPPRSATLRWDDAIKRWRLSTNRGDDIRARFVVMAQGPYNRPKLPGIPGIKDFKGHTFHSARWDYDYTGGDADGGLDKLADKRVALVGTGATGVQVVPHLGRDAKHLYRLPAHAVVCGRARQPADRPGMGGPRCSRAGRRSASATSTTGAVRGCRVSASRTWSATSGPSSAAT